MGLFVFARLFLGSLPDLGARLRKALLGVLARLVFLHLIALGEEGGLKQSKGEEDNNGKEDEKKKERMNTCHLFFFSTQFSI